MENSYSQDLAMAPLRYLSGEYNQNYIDQDALKNFTDAMYQREKNQAVAAARTDVKANDDQTRENNAYTAEKTRVQGDLRQAEAELALAEQELRDLETRATLLRMQSSPQSDAYLGQQSYAGVPDNKMPFTPADQGAVQ